MGTLTNNIYFAIYDFLWEILHSNFLDKGIDYIVIFFRSKKY
ncbi:hypothetical protein LEP1GSC172_2978 [Leptospira noguchii]|uniref:Uncharacterized protein n=1 Tax=Leptospira noguchii TaxID=28182 RepID=M6V5H2_9LEPT|nr:hypothetical protein LEP1GSC172_2978 [Leptospira noguchii]